MHRRQRGQRPGSIAAELAPEPELAYLAGRTMGDLLDAEARATAATLAAQRPPGAPSSHCRRLDEEALGALLMHFMLETILAGRPAGRRSLRPARGRGGQGPGPRISRQRSGRLHDGHPPPARPTLVNRIAAGEVVERPASAVKELVENAIDAGATRIEVVAARRRPRRCIAVTDDGSGMTPDELALAVERHATSKLPRRRPRSTSARSASAARRCRRSARSPPGHRQPRRAAPTSAWQIAVDGGAQGRAGARRAQPHGTRVEVRDLFYATPARLKFLKERAHRARAMRVDAVQRLAMAHPDVAFTLTDDGARR